MSNEPQVIDGGASFSFGLMKIMRLPSIEVSTGDIMTRYFVARGYLRAFDGNSQFRYREAEISFGDGPKTSGMINFLIKHKRESGFGHIVIPAAATGERQIEETEPRRPIDVIIHMTGSNFDRIWDLVQAAIYDRRVLELTVRAESNELVTKFGHSIVPDDLDFSADREYPVVSFELYPTSYRLPAATEVIPKQADRYLDDRAVLEMRIAEVRFSTSDHTMKICEIKFNGNASLMNQGIDIKIDVEINEYEKSFKNGDYPETAPLGIFTCYPSKDGFAKRLRVTVYFTQTMFERLYNLMAIATAVALELGLDITRESLASADSKIEGEVSSRVFYFNSVKTKF